MAIKKEYKTLALLLFLLGIGVLFLGAISLSGTGATLLDFFRALSVQFGFIVIGVIAYSTTVLGNKLLGLGDKKLRHIVGGVIIGTVYILASSLIPGLAIATPLLPGAVSNSLQGFVVMFVAPVVETIFFLGVVLALFLSWGLSQWKSIILQAGIFASFHLGAYLIGLYDYSATQGFLGFTANISVFVSAFIFGILSGYLVKNKNFKGLLIAMVVHAVINIFVFTKFAITFAVILGII